MASIVKRVKLKRGLKVNLPQLQSGEPAYTKDEKELYIGTDTGNIKLTSKSEIVEHGSRITLTEGNIVDINASLANKANSNYVDTELAERDLRLDGIDENIIDHGQNISEINDSLVTVGTQLAENVAQIALKADDSRVDNIVAQSGTDNTEIVDARGIYTVLGQRLNFMELSTDRYRIINNLSAAIASSINDVELKNTRTGTINFTLTPTTNTVVVSGVLQDRGIDSFSVKDTIGTTLVTQSILQSLDKLATWVDVIEHTLYKFTIKKRLKRIDLKDKAYTFKPNSSTDDGLYMSFTCSISDLYNNNSTAIGTHLLCNLLPNNTYSNIVTNKTAVEGIANYNATFGIKLLASKIGAVLGDSDATKVSKLISYLTAQDFKLLYAMNAEVITEITNTDFFVSFENAILSVAQAGFGCTVSVDVPMLLDVEILKQDVLNKQLEKKKIVCFGDSITDSSTYPTHIAALTGATVYNVGFGGCLLQQHPTRTDYDAFCMWALANAIVTDDWTYQNVGVLTVEPNFQPHLDLLKSIDFNTVDMITLLFGANDWKNGQLIGDTSVDNISTDNLNGALNYVFQTLLVAYPHLKILIMTPTWRMMEYETDKRGSDVTLAGVPARHIYNDVSKAILDRAFDYKIPCYDLYKDCGWNWMTKALYTTDGTHPTEAGSKLLGEKIASKLIATFR